MTQIKLTAIYKFTNDQSHITGNGFDPSLVAETQKNIRRLLEMIQAVFPEHYKILVESIGQQSTIEKSCFLFVIPDAIICGACTSYPVN